VRSQPSFAWVKLFLPLALFPVHTTTISPTASPTGAGQLDPSACTCTCSFSITNMCLCREGCCTTHHEFCPLSLSESFRLTWHPAPSSNLALASPASPKMNKLEPETQHAISTSPPLSASVTILGCHVRSRPPDSCRAGDTLESRSCQAAGRAMKRRG
jgi:hypothetical protein